MVIDSNNSQEHCWAFDGDSGYVTIQLAAAVYPKLFTLVHINVGFRQNIQAGNAPKNFAVYNVSPGLSHTLLLGEFVFQFDIVDAQRETQQLFKCGDVVKY
jgi:hypothetical protein